MKDERRYHAEGIYVYDRRLDSEMWVASVTSATLARKIANALNVYRSKVRRRKSAEKAVNSRPQSR